MRHFKAFPSYLPAAPRRPMAAPPALAEDRSDCYRGVAPPRSPRGLMVRAARFWHRAGASRGPAVTPVAPSPGCRSRARAAHTTLVLVPAPERRLRGCGRRRSRPREVPPAPHRCFERFRASCGAERGRARQDSGTGDGTMAPAPEPGRAGLGGQRDCPSPVAARSREERLCATVPPARPGGGTGRRAAAGAPGGADVRRPLK